MDKNSETRDFGIDLPNSQSNKIKVISVGGAGHNVLETISSNTIENVDYIVCDTDTQSLKKSQLKNKLQLGVTTVNGTEGNAELGRLLALESSKSISQLFDKNSETAIFIAGFGGGTGTGSIPVMVQMAKEKGLITIVIAYTPFDFEIEMRSKTANKGIEELKKQADFVLVIDNNKIQKAYGNLSFKTGFGNADKAAGHLLKIVTSVSSSNSDTNNLKFLIGNIKQGQSVFFGYGEAQGKFREKEAVYQALKNVLSDREDISGVKNIFINIGHGSTEITINELDKIKEIVMQNAGNEANATILIKEDVTLNDSLSVAIIAS